jgi:hypothetical protein
VGVWTPMGPLPPHQSTHPAPPPSCVPRCAQLLAHVWSGPCRPTPCPLYIGMFLDKWIAAQGPKTGLPGSQGNQWGSSSLPSHLHFGRAQHTGGSPLETQGSGLT